MWASRDPKAQGAIRSAFLDPGWENGVLSALAVTVVPPTKATVTVRLGLLVVCLFMSPPLPSSGVDHRDLGRRRDWQEYITNKPVCQGVMLNYALARNHKQSVIPAEAGIQPKQSCQVGDSWIPVTSVATDVTRLPAVASGHGRARRGNDDFLLKINRSRKKPPERRLFWHIL
jgi:hypothetical protein